MKVSLWLVVFTAKNLIAVPSHPCISSCSGFCAPEIIHDSYFSAKGGEVSYGVRREEGTRAGVRTQIFIKRSMIHKPKCCFPGMAPKSSEGTARSKDADTSQPAGGTGAERWVPVLRSNRSLGYSLKRKAHAALEVRNTSRLFCIWAPGVH